MEVLNFHMTLQCHIAGLSIVIETAQKRNKGSHTRTAHNSTTWRGDEEKRNFREPKQQLFRQNEGLFKASTASIVSRLRAHEKWRRCGDRKDPFTRTGKPVKREISSWLGSRKVSGALLTGNFSHRLEEGWERFTVGKTGEHDALTSSVGASVVLEFPKAARFKNQPVCQHF